MEATSAVGQRSNLARQPSASAGAASGMVFHHAHPMSALLEIQLSTASESQALRPELIVIADGNDPARMSRQIELRLRLVFC